MRCPSDKISAYSIGVGHPDTSSWDDHRPKLSGIASRWILSCSATAARSATRPKNADNWQEVPGGGGFFWRCPDNVVFYDIYPTRIAPRHNHRASTGYADGHAAVVKVSTLGFQYYPGRAANGQLATGDTWLGFNGLWDERWKWDLH